MKNREKIELLKSAIIKLMEATDHDDVQEVGGNPLDIARDFTLDIMDAVFPKGTVGNDNSILWEKGRIIGCQSLNHSVCKGELWECENCHKKVCWEEGSTSDPEICDDCWSEKCLDEMLGIGEQ